MKNLSHYERIMQIIEAKAISIQNAETLCGLGATTLSKLKTRNGGKGKLNKDNLAKVLGTFRVEQKWWDTGEGDMFVKEIPKSDSDSLHRLLLESLQAISTILLRDDKVLDQNGKLIDQNGELIADKRKEVERLDRANVWAHGQIDRLTSKLGGTKEM